MVNGGNHDGSVYKGDLDQWSFLATNGNPIVVRMAALSNDNGQFGPMIRLYGPDGSLLGDDKVPISGVGAVSVSVTATNNGTFTVLVSDDTGGSSGVYRVLSSTNLALPILQWVPVQTNQFSGVGGFIFTNLIDPAKTEEFFRLTYP